MEIYCFVVCLMLFTSVAAFTIPDSIPEFGKNDSLLQIAENEGCNCKNGRCVTDNKGKMKCACKPGYAPQDEFTCQPCDCGVKGKCIFIGRPKSGGGVTYSKKCICDIGSADKDGKCVDCHCGENSECEFEGEEKNCYCIEGYSAKNGVCTKCDCGFYGECKFEKGNKICTCDEGFLEDDGLCKECNCGDAGKCSIREGMKSCDCMDGFSENDGICEECSCGYNSIACSFADHKKTCKCKEAFADRNGECIECNCGDLSTGCRYYGENKHCECKEGHVQRGEWCEAGCNDYRPCHNGGHCERSLCKCLKGTEGDFCQVIADCEFLCPKTKNISCTFDVEKLEPFCKCVDEKLGFDPERQVCRKTCDSGSMCQNGGTCNRKGYSWLCDCPEGTAGDACEEVPECNKKNCGYDAKCVYSLDRKSGVCECKDNGYSFDEMDNRCRKTCDSNYSPCQNGGICSRKGHSFYCECLEGTTGDMCQDVPDCWKKDCGYWAECMYSVERKSAVCVCKLEEDSFDEKNNRCRKPCYSDSMCRNGATCNRNGDSSFCDCLEGTAGDMCEDVYECKEKDCGYDAKCVYRPERKSAVCECVDEGRSFDDKEKRCRKTCDSDSMCQNGANCNRNEDSSFCDCLEGTTGDMCEHVHECKEKDCGYDAKCVYSPERKSALCECVDEGRSFDEKEKRCRKTCDRDDSCHNGGECSFVESEKFCKCLPGTQGDLCEIVTGCLKNDTRCKDGAYCAFDVQKQKAVCRCPGVGKQYDVLSEKCNWPCDEDAMCKYGGLCMHRGDYLFCQCKLGTSGMYCNIVDDCASGLCGYTDGVRCAYDTDKEAAVCECKDPRQLYEPVSRTCKACDCGRNAVSCMFEKGEKVCSCLDGYVSKNGICQKQSCTEKKCFDGKCEVVNNEEVCTCFEGYALEGDYCRKLNCSKTACTNGTCVVRYGNVEECVCPAGYSLNKDICIRGACRQDTCYGGTCEMIEGELMCVCPPKFHLEGIGCYETVCMIQRCFGGKCVVEDKKEFCSCLDGYILVNDVCKKILCEKKSCFGGKCDIVDGKEECTCPPGYSLFQDVCRVDQILH